MSHSLKCIITAVLLALTLSACKPGIYYDPVADKKKAEMARQTQATAPQAVGSTATVAKVTAPIAGEDNANMVIPG